MTAGFARRLGFGLATVLGLARRGFFIPYRYAAALPGGDDRTGYTSVEALFAGCEGEFRELLASIEQFADDLLSIGDQPPPAPRWTQDWFPRVDAAAAYALVRQGAPDRIVEVGSGHSTRFLARAVADAGHSTRMTTIDPAPRAKLLGLADRVTLIRNTVQAVGIGAFTELAAGDMLVIDSSHILMPGTDVDFLLNRVLPALPSGVLVHFHDIFLPDDYPTDWAWRAYNEQLGVAALLSGGVFEPLFASHYVVTRLGETVARAVVGRLPLQPGARESSLWLRKR